MKTANWRSKKKHFSFSKFSPCPALSPQRVLDKPRAEEHHGQGEGGQEGQGQVENTLEKYKI